MELFFFFFPSRLFDLIVCERLTFIGSILSPSFQPPRSFLYWPKRLFPLQHFQDSEIYFSLATKNMSSDSNLIFLFLSQCMQSIDSRAYAMWKDLIRNSIRSSLLKLFPSCYWSRLLASSCQHENRDSTAEWKNSIYLLNRKRYVL